MLVNLYVEALLVDENQADQVWQLWDAAVITDDVAAWAHFKTLVTPNMGQ